MFDENDVQISNPRQTMIQMTEYSDNILDSPQLCASSRSVNIWDQSRVRCGDMIKDKGQSSSVKRLLLTSFPISKVMTERQERGVSRRANKWPLWVLLSLSSYSDYCLLVMSSDNVPSSERGNIFIIITAIVSIFTLLYPQSAIKCLDSRAVNQD